MPDETPTEKWSLSYLNRQIQGMTRLFNGLASDVEDLSKASRAYIARSHEVEAELRAAKLALIEVKLVHESSLELINKELDRLNKHVETLTARLTELEPKHTALETRLKVEEDKCEKVAGYLRKEIEGRKTNGKHVATN